MKMVFKAKSKCGGVRGEGGDIYVSGVNGGGTSRHALCVRFTADVLDRLRWRIGDRVYMELDREGSTDTWTFVRVSENDPNGLKISGKEGSDGPGTVRRSCDEDEISSVFPGGRGGYPGFMIEGNGKSAVFAVDTSASK